MSETLFGDGEAAAAVPDDALAAESAWADLGHITEQEELDRYKEMTAEVAPPARVRRIGVIAADRDSNFLTGFVVLSEEQNQINKEGMAKAKDELRRKLSEPE